ncbi:MAG: rod shape-determining protein MreC [Solirubrobacteraceae bacterium]|nr:rod shape-determining protein MreC [Solirubrobacteraceae bacterium]
MYDKSLRRRRVALALLVACSLLLLTVYFGESAGGGLHSVQRGALEVLSPIQEGASRVLKPARDLARWIGDTVDAKGRVSDLERENEQLRRQAIAGTDAVRQNVQLRRILGLDDAAGLAATRPVTARVIGQSPTVWYGTITIDKGSGDGVRVGQPAITGDGLVGQVTTATPGSAIVTLITDSRVAVSARVSENGVRGVVQTSAGGASDLRLRYTTRSDRVERGWSVVTAGTSSAADRLQSLYPPGIPIGRVTRVTDAGTDTQQVEIAPYANLRRLEIVQVLTARPNGNRP